MIRWLISVCIAAVLQGCAGHSVEARQNYADTLIEQAGWVSETILTPSFQVFSAHSPQSTPNESLKVFIEGDGLAWVSRHRPSQNPTPIAPVALALAVKAKQNTAYLARPCQYVTDSLCRQSYWTSARFAPEIIQAMDAALSQLKTRAQAAHIELIGYSGGGAIAMLLAARRDDVTHLTTIAGNLDTLFWANWHDITPLKESLNPADHWRALVGVPQIHYVGENDRIVPPAVTQAYLARVTDVKVPHAQVPDVHIVPHFDHHCCWVTQWPDWMQ